MEHRLKKRCELSMDSGVQLSSKTVPARKIVEIELSPGVCLHGWVVHVEDGGIGIMFHSVGNWEERFLEQLLLENCAPPGARRAGSIREQSR